MRIHSNPTAKMIQQVDAVPGNTPASSGDSRTMISHAEFPRDEDLPSEASRGSDRDEDDSDAEDLDYRESWDLLFSGILEDPCRLSRKCGCGRDLDASSAAAPQPSKRWQVDQQKGASTRAKRVRRYKKWVSLRLGSFDWSFALFFVVKSRSSSRSCDGGYSDPGEAESTAPLSAT